jgi:hypothetical protein
MMENKTTPGPWKCERQVDARGKPYATLYNAHIDIGVCMVWAPPGNLEQEANARLIAATPALLEVCRNTIALTCKHASEEHSKLWAEAAAAYRLALGDS